LRVELAKSYTSLIETMNPNVNDGVLEIDTQMLVEELDNMGQLIITLCACYTEGDEECKSMIDELDQLPFPKLATNS
ncbi:hypothetical protein, partial [Streptococcus pneumoniae]|uniref:hypothetical protein n=1 Tax=Streptococcus pneumoniae TaxID=1313 RepID=UPI001E64C065